MKSFKQYLEERGSSKKLTVVFGRFNPPTIGHEKLLNASKIISSGGDLKIYASQSQDAKKNPLGYDEKIKFMRKMFPKFAREIIIDKSIKNLFDIAAKAYQDGYTDFVVVAGSDRVKAFDAMLSKYNGVEAKHGLYDFKSLTIESAGERDPDADDVSGMSASKMRELVKNNDLQGFTAGVPSSYKSSASELFKAVQSGMGLKESNNFRKHIQFEPVSEVREKYIEGNYLEKGMPVQIVESGEPSRIQFLGTNYVILENGKRYWLEQIQPLQEKSPQRYHSGLSKSTSAAREKHFEKGEKMDDNNPAAYKPAPGDARAETKPSKYTKAYKKKFGESTKVFKERVKSKKLCEEIEALKNKSEKSGIPYDILKKVYDRGMAAWRTGHRPGTTPQQWALARVNSFIVGGKTRKTTDADLWKQYKG